MPSPAVQIKEDAGSYAPATDGFDATPGSTITINLVSGAGVSTWSITCITTDDTSSASAVTSALVIDPVLKTATFTAPSAGKAYRFQSKINNGVDVNGVAQPSYTTTFCVYTLVGGRRVGALDETFESNSTFGWCASINGVIRNPSFTTPTGTGFAHISAGSFDSAATANIRYAGGKLQTDGNIQWRNTGDSNRTGDLVWVPTTSGKTITLPDATGQVVLRDTIDTLTNKTLTSPTINTPTISSPTITGSVSGLVLTTPQLNDTSADHQYVFAVSELGADRTVTWPLLTGNDTLVFEAHTQTLANKTLTSPTLGGTVTFSATSMQATGNSRAQAFSDISSVQTTDATVTSLFTWTIRDEAATKVVAEVCGDRSTGAETAAYVRQVRIKRDGGTVTVGTVDTPFTSEEVGTWDCTIDNSTSTGRIRVTGVAAVTIDWGGVTSRLEVNHA